MDEVSCKLNMRNSSCSSYLDFANKWWSHSFLKVIYRSVWVQDLNYLLKLQKTILVCHRKGEDKKKKALLWHSYWYVIKVSINHFTVKREFWLVTYWVVTRMMIAMTHFQRCQQDQGDVEKAELIKGNNKTPLWHTLKKYTVEQNCGIQQSREAFTMGTVKMLKTIRNKELKFQFNKWWCGMLRNATFMKWKSNAFLQQFILDS